MSQSRMYQCLVVHGMKDGHGFLVTGFIPGSETHKSLAVDPRFDSSGYMGRVSTVAV
jgi:hypothetical protein